MPLYYCDMVNYYHTSCVWVLRHHQVNFISIYAAGQSSSANGLEKRMRSICGRILLSYGNWWVFRIPYSIGALMHVLIRKIHAVRRNCATGCYKLAFSSRYPLNWQWKHPDSNFKNFKLYLTGVKVHVAKTTYQKSQFSPEGGICVMMSYCAEKPEYLEKTKCPTWWLQTTLHATAWNQTWFCLVRGQGINRWTSSMAPDSNWDKRFTQIQFGKGFKSLASVLCHAEHMQTSLGCQEVVNSYPLPYDVSGPPVNIVMLSVTVTICRHENMWRSYRYRRPFKVIHWRMCGTLNCLLLRDIYFRCNSWKLCLLVSKSY